MGRKHDGGAQRVSHTIYIPAQDRVWSIKRLVEFLNALPVRNYQVEVKEHRSGRSIQQNRYLFGVAYPILRDLTGYSIDDIHTYTCGTFFGWKTVKCPKTPSNPSGAKDEPIRTTTRNEDGKRDVVSWAVFDDLTATVQRIGADAGVYIPDPDPALRKTG